MTRFVKLTRCAQLLLSFFLHFAHGSFVMLGVIVISLCAYQLTQFGLEGLNPRVLFSHQPSLAAGSDVVLVQTAYADAVVPSIPGMSAGQARLVAGIAKRHRISASVVESLLKSAQKEGAATGLDPLLILAVITVESSFNPFAESSMGAQGLMQIIPRYHPEKISPAKGEMALFDPAENIHVGSRIIQEYLRATGSLDAALQQYAGAASDPEKAYAERVMQEYERLRVLANQFDTRTASKFLVKTSG